jgi:hypothetical protein
MNDEVASPAAPAAAIPGATALTHRLQSLATRPHAMPVRELIDRYMACGPQQLELAGGSSGNRIWHHKFVIALVDILVRLIADLARWLRSSSGLGWQFPPKNLSCGGKSRSSMNAASSRGASMPPCGSAWLCCRAFATGAPACWRRQTTVRRQRKRLCYKS